jgi:hypothetical protein
VELPLGTGEDKKFFGCWAFTCLGVQEICLVFEMGIPYIQDIRAFVG